MNTKHLFSGFVALQMVLQTNAQPVGYSYDAGGNLVQRSAGALAAPVILGQPQVQIVEPGGFASFSVLVADSRGCAYQWRFNNANLPGRTGDSLLLVNVDTNNQGQYSVVVTNNAGSVTSSLAQLYLDSNRNGLPDSWELAYFGNLNQNAAGDFDGDGISNLQEFYDGTNPTNRTFFRSRLTLLSDGGGFVNVTPFQPTYSLTDTVTLTATPYPPNSFLGWSGSTNTQNNPIALVMDTNKTVQARFLRAVPPAGMVAWWRAENNALDAVGTNHGLLTNGATFSPGKVGQAFALDGVTQWVEFPDAPALRPASLTIEGWVQFAAADGVRVIFAKPLGSGTLDTFGVWLENGSLRAVMSDAAGFGPFLGVPFSPIVGRWYHIAFTFDDATKQETLYLDGRNIANAISGRALGYDSHAVLLGRDTENGVANFFFAGSIDETAIYNRALSPAEINSIFSADVAGKDPALPIITSLARLPDAAVGTGYTQQLAAVSGGLPISFSLSAGLLPNGLTLSSNGVISGVPTSPGSNVFATVATSSAGQSAELVCGLRVLTPVIVPGLVSWWRAESDALDSVGTNHGVLTSGATFAQGKVGQAFSFDGVGSYVQVGNVSGLDFSNSVSFEAWIFPTGPGSHPSLGGVILNKENEYELARFADGTIGWAFANSSPGWNWVGTGFVAPLNQWTHLVVVYSNGGVTTYANGAQVHFFSGFGPIGFFQLGQNDFRIGGRQSASQFFQGSIDESSVYNRVLSAADIVALYNAGVAGKVAVGPYLNTPPLPDALVGQSYTQTITSVRGVAPVTYTLASGVLPPGMSLSPSGLLSGTPTIAGGFSFTIRATDAALLSNSAAFTLQVYSPVPPSRGIAGWWRAESNALDAIGTNHGVLRNGASFAAGKVGQAFALNGSGQSVDIADAPAVRPASITLEAWVMFNSLAGLQHIFAKPLAPAGLDSYGIWVNNGTLFGSISDTNGFGPNLTAPFPPALGTWHHVAYTFDDASKQEALYLDGTQVAVGVANKSISYDNSPFLLGRDIENGTPTFFLVGQIDEAAIYNRALGSNEVASLYSAGPAGKTSAGPYFTTPPVLPFAVVSQAYTQTLATLRGTNLVTFAVTAGTLPPGLTLTSAGVLSGTPTSGGNFSFVATATDALSLSGSQQFTLQVWPRVPPPRGIAGWWRAENNTLDSIGGNDGFLINNATFAAGKVGQAFSLNGVSDAIEIEDAPALRPTSVTLEAWAMFLSAGAQTIMAKPLGNGNADSYILWLDNGNLNGAIADSTGASVPISVPFLPAAGQWYHLAFTFDDATKQQILYLNGSPVAFGLANLAIGYDTHPLLLGADVNSGTMSPFLQGRIDEATLYNRALSAVEIASVYSADAAGKATDGPYITTPPVLPDAAYGNTYTQNLSSVHGTPPVSYALTGGALPAGVTLNSQGRLSGAPTNLLGVIPTNATVFNFTVRATDAPGLWAEARFSLRVAAPVPPVPGLISWWRAESSALDAIGTNHGVALNGTSYAPGQAGQAFALDGINDCVQIPDSPGLRPLSLTIECWVMFAANTGARTIFAKPLGAGTLDSFSLWLENGTLRAIVCDNTGGGPVLSAPFTPVVGQWYHLAYTFDGLTSQQVLYLNNVTLAIGTSDRTMAYDANPVLLGCDIDNGNRAWFVQGRIDEAAIYNRALNANEIAAIYYAGAAGRTTSGPYFTTSPTLPDAIISQNYTLPITAVRGTAPVSYTLGAGSLPPGMSVSSSGGLNGIPTSTGVFNFTIRATDAALLFCEQAFHLQVYAPVLAPMGLVGWWRGESSAVDELGAHNGTLQGNATYGPGRVGTAFNLDGINSYVNLGAWTAGSNWTIEAWVNPSARPGGRHTIFGDLANCSDWALELTDGQLGVEARLPFGCASLVGSGVYPSPGFWQHVAATCDGTNASIYVNGILSGTVAVDRNYIGDATGVRIGSAICCGEYFPGLVDEVSVYNRPLTGAEIASIFNAGPAGKQLVPPIVLHVSAQGNVLTLSFQAAMGTTYTIESRGGLASGSWSPVVTVMATSGTVTTNLPIAGAQRFYRARTGN